MCLRRLDHDSDDVREILRVDIGDVKDAGNLPPRRNAERTCESRHQRLDAAHFHLHDSAHIISSHGEYCDDRFLSLEIGQGLNMFSTLHHLVASLTGLSTYRSAAWSKMTFDRHASNTIIS